MSSAPDSYYLRRGDHRYRPTAHASGAWLPDEEQHMGPVSGLLVHELELFREAQGRDLAVSRISFDILGRLHAGEVEVHVEVVRPGRTIELLEATMTSGGRPVVRARAWLLAEEDTTAVAGGAPDPLPPPETLPSWSPAEVWPGGYIASLDVRRAPDARPGRARAWLRTPLDLVDGESSTDLARYVTLVDTANGLAVRHPPREWLFANVDLTVHLHRRPAGPWVGLDLAVVFGPRGQGLTSSVLHDEQGAVGRAEQILTLRRRG